MNNAEVDLKSEIIQDREGRANIESELIKIRKEKLIKFLKTKYTWITYILLAAIVLLSARIRTSNLDKLKDVTTETWTLGPDLDPFYFLRLAEYIVEHGKLFAIDMMRYVPFGFDMQGEYLLHPYLIAWFHKIAVYFGSDSVTYSAIIYPVFMFALTVIAFFFLSRKIFLNSLGKKQANIIGLVSAFFLSVLPIFLPRTIAGIPEKESAAFVFMFLAFYFFLCSWNADKKISRYAFALFAGMATTAMANIWGGYIFIFLSLAPAAFVAFILGHFNDKNKIFTYTIWLFSSFILMYFSSIRYSFKGLLISISTAPSAVVFFIIIIHLAIFNTKLKDYLKIERLPKMPPYVVSLFISIALLAILSTIFLGVSFIPSQINSVVNILVQPAISRLIQTVAENRQPFFGEWAGNFGPFVRNIPIFFWLFFTGSIYLFYNMVSILAKKERLYLTLTYFIFLFGIIFSRYSESSILNGTNFTSLILYAAGIIILLFGAGFYCFKYYKEGKAEQLKKIDFNLILLIMLFILSIVAARAAVRTVMMLAPPASIIVAYFFTASLNKTKELKESTLKIFGWLLITIIFIATLFSGYQFYKEISGQAEIYAPSGYNQQWQKAMAWVRENTRADSVFGHWWDYGYWIQTIGKRATVLDGGNSIGYWNHLMGRYALTGIDNREAIEFLYTHNTTHFLIDSSDIGKYGAFSSIGSDTNYDRRSYIATFLRDKNQVVEKKNSTLFIYSGGSGLDEDLIYDDNGTQIFLPASKSGIGAILIEKSNSGNLTTNPIGIFVYQDKQYNLPLRYAYVNNNFIDFGSGVESGVYIFPKIEQNSIEPDGAMLYLPKRIVRSQLARLYLYKETNPYFKLVHTEDDFIVAQVKSMYPDLGDIVFFEGVRGPIRIWEINYPSDIKFKEEYIKTESPKEIYYT